MDPAGPDDLLAGLDDAQREAVTTPALPLCVLAGAGSGKTRVLTRRIAWRCATGADDPRRVLALTFTRSAATELSTRLRALGLRDGVRTGTFHAVAWAELRARSAEAGRTPPVLLDRPARLLARVADLDRSTLLAVAGELAWARARAIPLARYPDEARRAGRATAVDPERVIDLGGRYHDEKRRRGLVDFDDLLERLTAVLAGDPGYAAAQRWRFAHLYVDEFQDLNPLQHQLLEGWRGGRDALTAVGDPNQAIYGWNGSDPAFIEQFTELYPGAAVVAIDRNYRSVAPVLELANALLDAGRLGGVRLRSFRGDGPMPEVAGFADADEEVVALARAVLDAKVPGTSWGQQAVLARTNALLEPAEAALRAAGVPVRVRGRVAFHEQPAVRAALRELASPGPSFAQAVARLAEGLDPDAIARDVVDDPLATDDADDADDRLGILRLVELAERYQRAHPGADGAGFRGWLLNEVDDLPGGDGVDLVTFHGAKGREWPVVHVVGVEDGLVPIARARTAAAADEERRLFYVACTRAEQRLRITWAARRAFGGGDPAGRRPSPYLADVAPVLERLRADATPSRPATLPRLGSGAGPPDRVDVLRRWRATRAKAAGIAPTALLPDEVLTRLAEAAPGDASALAAIPGTRPLVLAGFADELVESLRG
jgi:DNA helicase-2/ATP-dependent DNA helicase PcrA